MGEVKERPYSAKRGCPVAFVPVDPNLCCPGGRQRNGHEVVTTTATRGCRFSYSDAHLTLEERNLLSIEYKHITASGTLRTSWRTVQGTEKQEATSGRATTRASVCLPC